MRTEAFKKLNVILWVISGLLTVVSVVKMAQLDAEVSHLHETTWKLADEIEGLRQWQREQYDRQNAVKRDYNYLVAEICEKTYRFCPDDSDMPPMCKRLPDGTHDCGIK